jgi:hypothetical protein
MNIGETERELRESQERGCMALEEQLSKDFEYYSVKSEIAQLKMLLAERDAAHALQLESIKSELEKDDQFNTYEPEFLALQKKLNVPFQNYVLAHAEEIGKLIESEIVGRYYYQKGKSIHSFRHDPVMKNGIILLQSPEQYKKTLNIK